MSAPLPALLRTSSHFAVEDITAGNSSAAMPSLTETPAGADKFNITLTDPLGFGRHIMPLIFAAAGTSAFSKGPAAKPLSTQPATASEIAASWPVQLDAFLLAVAALAAPRQPMSAPSFSSLHTISTRSILGTPVASARLYSFLEEIKANPLRFLLTGNLAQKLALVCSGSPSLDLNCFGGGPTSSGAAIISAARFFNSLSAAIAAGATPVTNSVTNIFILPQKEIFQLFSNCPPPGSSLANSARLMPILYGINRLLRIFPYIQPIMHMLTNSARLVPTLFAINRLLRIFLYIQPIMHMCAACTGVCAKHMHSLHTVLPPTSFLCMQDHQLQLGFTAQKPFTYYVHTCA